MGVGLERNASYPMKHEEGEKHVGEVDQRPRTLLCHARDGVDQDFANGNEHGMDQPRTLLIDPLDIDVGVRGLVLEHVFGDLLDLEQ